MKLTVHKLFAIIIIASLELTFISCGKDNPIPDGDSLKPVITSIFPDSGNFGTTVYVKGKNFDPHSASNTVTVNGVKAIVNQASDSSLTITIPLTSTGVITVKTIDSTKGPVFNYTHDIIVAGFQGKHNGGAYVSAICWINGRPILLTNGSSNAEAHGIATSGNDLYIVGFEYLGGTSIAKIWKNNEATSLNDVPHSARANAIVIVGNDVYVAGFESDGNSDIATVWKNGVPQRLTRGHGNAIIVSGNNIYVGGEEVISPGISVAKIWKNGVETVLSDSASEYFVKTIALSGTDVYAAGYDNNNNIGNYMRSRDRVWKNGVLQPPLVQSPSTGEVWGISVNGSNIYYAGSATGGAPSYNTTAYLWRNNGPTFFGKGASFSQFSAIQMVGSDIYLAGFQNDQSGHYVAKVYKNESDTTYADPVYSLYPFALLYR